MTATFDQATDEILAVFKTAWDATGHIAVYENVEGAKPTAQDPWARPTINHGTGNETLGGAGGVKRYDRTGILTIQVFIPNGQGLSPGNALGKILADAFEGVATPSQVWFRNFRFLNIGPAGEWFQFNAVVDFAYDEVK